MKSLAGRRALVTGASVGIGRATAVLMAEAGAEVTLLARRRDRLELAAKSCPGAKIVAADVRDAEHLARELADKDFDVIVNNAGLALGVDKLPGGSPAEWSTVIDTNIKGVLNVLAAVLPRMVARGTGDVVTLGSVAGRQVYPGGAVYCASKHAVRAVYEALRLDLAGSGLRFTTVDPGLVGGTEFSQVRMRGDLDRAKAVYTGLEPLRPEDVAEAIVWAITRPPHVNVGEIVMWAAAQASTTVVTRKENAR
jgi:NADP-dependent 3-hydroxy acid dehydrogenase YdfG